MKFRLWEWCRRLRGTFRHDDRDLDQELRFHQAMAEEEAVRRAQSVREARLRVGGRAQAAEAMRDQRGLLWLADFLRDSQHAVRLLARSPSFAVAAILSLALGIGANTAIFQLVDAVRLRTLPVESPRELVTIDLAAGASRRGSNRTRSARLTYAQWDQIREQQQAFTGVLAWSATRFNLASGGEARYAESLYVSGNFFRLLGIRPLIGRVFTDEDDKNGCGNPGAVVSDAFWHREFGGEADVLSRAVTLDGHAFPVIGVTPAAFFGPEVGRRYEIAVPLCADTLLAKNGNGRMLDKRAWWLSMMGRLKAGWTVERASQHLEALSPGIMRVTVPPNNAEGVRLYLANRVIAKPEIGASDVRTKYETPLWLLLAITGMVLLLACTNVTNLLLARASVREREVAVRLAVGASRGRLLRQLLAESLLLAVFGTVLGTAIAAALSRALIAFIGTANNPLFVGLALDGRVLAFALLSAGATCVLFGVAPALTATRVTPAASMRIGGRGTSDGRERLMLRRGLIAAQVAFSLVLLVAALLFVRSLRNLLTVDPGFRTDGLLTVDVDFSRLPYDDRHRAAICREVSQALAGLPGVHSAAQVRIMPLSGGGWSDEVHAEGATGQPILTNLNIIGPRYFRTIGTPLIVGRDFDERDTRHDAHAAIVNEAFARRVFGDTNPVGRAFVAFDNAVFPIVGLVKNTKYYDIREDFIPVAYLPYAQDEMHDVDTTFVLHAVVPADNVERAAVDAVRKVNPAVGLEFHVLAAQVQDSLLRERLMATLSGAFGVLAGVLATIGLYGMIAYAVTRRQKEIAVRIALGASRREVVSMVLREATALLGIGLAAGAILALWVQPATKALLFDVQPHDPTVVVIAIVLLTSATIAAAWLPARRAASIDPNIALRND
jgi:predicted permease